MKLTKKDDLFLALRGITYRSIEEAESGISEVKDNGITVYTNLKEIAIQPASINEPSPKLYEGEIILYSIETPGGETAYAGMISKVLSVEVSEGTTRGAKLRERGKTKQWLLIVKRFGVPKLHDVIDQYTVGSRLLFIMESIAQSSHEMKGGDISFEKIVDLLSSGCVKADTIMENVAGKAIGYSRDVETALDELTDPDNPPSVH